MSTVGPVHRDLDRRTGSMAHRRGLLSGKVWTFLGAGLLLAIMMTGRVLLLNQMTNMRANIAVQQDRKGFLETKSAALQKDWNFQTSAAVIRARSIAELGLISPEEPGLVLVKLPANQGNSRWRWPSWLEELAGGDPAVAENVQPATGSAKMVHLSPVSLGSGYQARDLSPNSRGFVH